MAKLKILIPHDLPQNEALMRIKALIEESRQEFEGNITNLREEWNGYNSQFSFIAVGFSVSGTIRVGLSEIELFYNLPLVASIFKNSIEFTIKERVKNALK